MYRRRLVPNMLFQNQYMHVVLLYFGAHEPNKVRLFASRCCFHDVYQRSSCQPKTAGLNLKRGIL